MMATEWHYKKGNETIGPLSGEKFRAAAKFGVLLPDDLVWKKGMKDWVPASKVKNLFTQESVLENVQQPSNSCQFNFSETTQDLSQKPEEIAKNKFVIDSYDKFEKHTIFKHTQYFSIGNVLCLRLVAHKKDNNNTSCFLEYSYENDKSAYLEEGDLKILIDNRVIELKPVLDDKVSIFHEDLENPIWNYYTYKEFGSYRFTKQQLKNICEATSVDLRVSGRRYQLEVSGIIFQRECRQFYNGVFDKSTYLDSLNVDSTGCLAIVIALFTACASAAACCIWSI